MSFEEENKRSLAVRDPRIDRWLIKSAARLALILADDSR